MVLDLSSDASSRDAASACLRFLPAKRGGGGAGASSSDSDSSELRRRSRARREERALRLAAFLPQRFLFFRLRARGAGWRARENQPLPPGAVVLKPQIRRTEPRCALSLPRPPDESTLSMEPLSLVAQRRATAWRRRSASDTLDSVRQARAETRGRRRAGPARQQAHAETQRCAVRDAKREHAAVGAAQAGADAARQAACHPRGVARARARGAVGRRRPVRGRSARLKREGVQHERRRGRRARGMGPSPRHTRACWTTLAFQRVSASSARLLRAVARRRPPGRGDRRGGRANGGRPRRDGRLEVPTTLVAGSPSRRWVERRRARGVRGEIEALDAEAREVAVTVTPSRDRPGADRAGPGGGRGDTGRRRSPTAAKLPSAARSRRLAERAAATATAAGREAGAEAPITRRRDRG